MVFAEQKKPHISVKLSSGEGGTGVEPETVVFYLLKYPRSVPNLINNLF